LPSNGKLGSCGVLAILATVLAMHHDITADLKLARPFGKSLGIAMDRASYHPSGGVECRLAAHIDDERRRELAEQTVQIVG
jgi:hypothetical protein